MTPTVGQEALVNIQMALGNVAESITVEAAAPLVETTTGTISHVVSEQQLGLCRSTAATFRSLRFCSRAW